MKNLISKNLQTEVDAAYLYNRLAQVESEPAVAAIFKQMAEIENEHAMAFLKKSDINGKMQLPKPSYRAKTFDLIGKIISVLVDKTETAGEFNYNFSAKDLGLAKGTYLVKVKVNNKETTRKIIEL